MALTVKRINKHKNEPGRYGDGRGLYLEVTPACVASWTFRYQRKGVERWMGLGPLADFDLDEARERHRKARKLLKDGIDPIDARKAERAKQATEAASAAASTVTFKECAEQYFRFHSPKWTNGKHAKQFLSTLRTHVFPVFGRVPVNAIDKALVIKALEPIWYRIPETAQRTRGRIEAVLDFAKVRGYRDGGNNPAAWGGNLEHALPARGAIAKVEPHPALPYAQLPALMAELGQREGIAARCLEFTILTACRTSEATGARWGEFDLSTRTWTIPRERTKAGRQHKIPLCDRAIAILRSLPREGDFVFIGSRKGSAISSMAMAVLLKRMGRNDVTVHGFRSSFRDWAGERTSYPNHVIEMALAHAVGDKVERAYARSDLFQRRVNLMRDWAKFCATPPAQTASVTPIRRAR
jgi:integrase